MMPFLVLTGIFFCFFFAAVWRYNIRDPFQWYNPIVQSNGAILSIEEQIAALQSENDALKSRVESLSSNPRIIEQDFLRILNQTTPQLFPSHNLTSDIPHDLIRRSRTRVGDRNRFVELLHKLESGQCINVAVLGGSISLPFFFTENKLWFYHFGEWLDKVYPCNGSHNFVNKAQDARGTKYVLHHFYKLFTADPTAYDLVFAEFAVNDPYEGATEADTERLVRSLLQLPSDPMVMYVEMSWWDHSRKAPFWENAVYLHDRVLFYYQIPTVSTFNAIFPVHLYQHMPVVDYDSFTVHRRGAKNPCPRFILDGHHPNEDGHKLTALLIAFAFYEEQQLNIANPLLEVEVPQLPPIWNMIDLQDINEIPLMSLQFERANFNVSSMRAHLGGDWSHKPETKKMKWGLIAKRKNSMLSIAISVNSSVNIGYFGSYENVGTAAVWIDDAEIPEQGLECDRLPKRKVTEPVISGDGSEYMVLDGLWTRDGVSGNDQQRITIWNLTTSGPTTKWIHFCLPKDEKFKLHSLMSF